jgi:hypothetical protein
LDETHDRVLAVLADGGWHHADDLRVDPRWFDSQILAIVRALKSNGHDVDWRTSGTGDWYRLVPKE